MVKINHTSRNLKSINDPNLVSDLVERLSQLHNIDNLQTVYEEYIKAIILALDKHAPKITNKRIKRLPKSWCGRDAQNLKRQQKNGRKTLAKN